MTNDIDKNKLINAWILLRHAEENSPEYNDNFWAFNSLSDISIKEPELCWELIEKIRKKDGSDVVLSNLAAGPLEDLLVKHGNQFIDLIEKDAKKDMQFRKLLGAVWKNDIDDDVWTRIKRVAGPSW